MSCKHVVMPEGPIRARVVMEDSICFPDGHTVIVDCGRPPRVERALADAKVNPRPGDVLKNWGRTMGCIEINGRDGDLVWFSSDRCYRRESLEFFCRMATDAVVIRLGGDGR